MKGQFVSVWDSGTEISTNATLNAETGELIEIETVDVSEVDNLVREYFVSSEWFNSGQEFEVCLDCHCFILDVENGECMDDECRNGVINQ